MDSKRAIAPLGEWNDPVNFLHSQEKIGKILRQMGDMGLAQFRGHKAQTSQSSRGTMSEERGWDRIRQCAISTPFP